MDFKVLKHYFGSDFKKDLLKGLWTECFYWFVTNQLLRFSFCDITNPTTIHSWLYRISYIHTYIHTYIRDDFDFHIVNFPYLSSNMPSGPSYGVYISQLLDMHDAAHTTYIITEGLRPVFLSRTVS